MCWFDLLSYVLFGVIIVQLVRLIIADCDLLLAWNAKYGIKPGDIYITI